MKMSNVRQPYPDIPLPTTLAVGKYASQLENLGFSYLG